MLQPMVKLLGIGASPGVAMGQALTLDRRARVLAPKRHLSSGSEVLQEQARLRDAIERSDEQLVRIKGKVPETSEHASILETHRLMLRDPVVLADCEQLIADEKINAEWALKRVVRKLKTSFDELGDSYIRERRDDVEYVIDRVLRNLLGQSVDLEADGEIPERAIVVAHDLSPADLALLLRHGSIAGLVTELGGQTSHVAIVARARQIPAVVGIARAAELLKPGVVVAVDGQAGMVVAHPTREQVVEIHESIRRRADTEAEMRAIRDLPTVTADGHRVSLLANIEFDEEMPAVLANGADGIGLYRTEFLYLERTTLPSEEEHYETYRKVLQQAGERPVTIRTLDLGADKVPRDGTGKRREREQNPAMGLRAVRYCLKHRDLFMTQLRALVRASVHGQLRIMFPMITGLTELREAKSLLARAQEELAREGTPFEPNIPVGIMVETPAAAWAADKLARECDFFSIGTNDLIQYTLAIDRQNREVAYLYKPLHIAILRTIRHIIDTAREAKIPVAMCGEMAGDPVYSLLLLGMGLSEYSMVPAQIPLVKRIVRESRTEDGLALMERAFRLHTAEEIDRFVRAEMKARFGV